MESLNGQKFSIRYLTIAYLIPFILQVALFGFQISKGIISVWNVVAVFMMLFLYVFAVYNVRKANANLQTKMVSEKEKIEALTKKQQEKMAKKTRLIFLAIAFVVGAVSVLLFYLYSSKTKGLEIINSRVVDQWGETVVVVEETEDGVANTESDYIEVVVEYEFGGETKEALIKGTTTNKIYVDELKIYVDENGKFVADYGRLEMFKFEAIVLLSFACLMLIFAIFGIGGELVAGAVFMVFGVVLMFVMGSPFFENFLFNDMTCFFLLFANVGICLAICGILVKIFGKFSVYGIYNAKLRRIDEPAVILEEKSSENEILEIDNTVLYCHSCGEEVRATDKFCEHCGNKLTEE